MVNERRTLVEQLTDKHGVPFLGVATRAVVLARYVMANLSVTREVTLQDDTIIISVYAADKDIYLRWGQGVVTTAGSEQFDEIIPEATVREFAVPDQANGELHDTVSFMEREATAIMVMVEK